MRLRKKILGGLITLSQIFGTRLKDPEGRELCRAFIFSWGGRIYLIGLPNQVQLKPVPVPALRLSYWSQAMTWEQSGPPDFSRLGKIQRMQEKSLVCHVVICHLPPAATAAIFKRWRELDPSAVILIAHGGSEENFRKLDADLNAIFVPDASLRTADHPRERQQYAGVYRAADQWLAENSPAVTHVHFVEFDAIPLVPNLGDVLAAALAAEDADVIGYGLVDLTGTIHPQNRHQLADREFLTYLRSFSNRELPDRLLTMLGCSSFWTRSCFEEIARLSSAPRVYLEVAIPTLAHHLGYRVRPMPKLQEKFVTFEGDLSARLDESRSEGAWLLHPCKNIWKSEAGS